MNCVSHLTVRRFSSSELFKWIVLIDELIDRHETSTDPDYQIIFNILHDYLFLKEEVRSRRIPSHKEALHPLVRIALIDKFRELFIDRVILEWHILEVYFMELIPVL